MFGLSMEKILLLGVIAGLLIGPSRAADAIALVRDLAGRAGALARASKERVEAEVPDIDWQALNPSRYDPRRIVRDALIVDWKSDSFTSAPRSQPRARIDNNKTVSDSDSTPPEATD